MVVGLVALSVLAAFVIAASQSRPLGDEPLVMLVVGGLLAFGAGGLRLARSMFVGFAAMAGFPIWAVVDLARHGGHNLLPFEFGIYALYGAIGVAVAAVGHRLRGRTVERGE